MHFKSAIRSNFMRALASTCTLELQRQKARWSRKLKRKPAVVHYFHQVDDPYSHLCALRLAGFAKNYSLPVIPHLVGTPADTYLGDASRYWQWAASDAAAIAPGYGLSANFSAQLSPVSVSAAQAALANVLAEQPTSPSSQDAITQRFAAAAIEQGATLWADDPTAKSQTTVKPGSPTQNTQLQIDTGNRLRNQLGHFLGATFWFDGEWYWGLDRLHLLERRLQHEGFAPANAAFVAPPPEPMGAENYDPALLSKLTLEYFPSLRSPYSAVGQPRLEAMLSRVNVALEIKPVMPMLMRGIPAPFAKQRYILQDAAREARFLNVPFGNFVDPFGEPVKKAFALYPEAQRQGKAMEFVSAYLSAAFALGTDITSTQGLTQVAEAARLNYPTLVAGDNSNWQQILDANLQQMLDAGLWGVPSFRLTGGNTSKPFSCWGQDRLWVLESEIYRRCQTEQSDLGHS